MLERGWQDAVRGASRRDARRSARATTSSCRARRARRAGTRSPRWRTFRWCRGCCCAASARPATRRSRRATRWSRCWAASSRPAPSGASAPTWQGLAACVLPVDAARAHVHRLRHAAPAGRPHAAAAVGRAARQPVGLFVAAARGGHRRDRGLPVAVVDLLAVQADPRQGRHGLRRLQAAGGARRVARLADAAADRPAVVGGRRGRSASRWSCSRAATTTSRWRSARTSRSPA